MSDEHFTAVLWFVGYISLVVPFFTTIVVSLYYALSADRGSYGSRALGNVFAMAFMSGAVVAVLAGLAYSFTMPIADVEHWNRQLGESSDVSMWIRRCVIVGFHLFIFTFFSTLIAMIVGGLSAGVGLVPSHLILKFRRR